MHITALFSREVGDTSVKKICIKVFYVNLLRRFGVFRDRVECKKSEVQQTKRKYFQKYWFPSLRSGVLVSLWISASVFHGSSVSLVESEPRSMVMQSSEFYYIFCLFQLKDPSVRLRQERMHVRILRGTHIYVRTYTAVKPSFVSLSILPFLDCLIETCFLSCQPPAPEGGEVFVEGEIERESGGEEEREVKGKEEEKKKRETCRHREGKKRKDRDGREIKQEKER